MKALQKNQADHIAKLITRKEGSRIMLDACAKNCDWKMTEAFKKDMYTATVELGELGIILPTLERAQAFLNEVA